MTNFTTVKLYIYDISFGLASQFGSALLGRIIDIRNFQLVFICYVQVNISMEFGIQVQEFMDENIYLVQVEFRTQHPKKSVAQVQHLNHKRMFLIIDAEKNNFDFLDVILVKQKELQLKFKHGFQRKVRLIFGKLISNLKIQKIFSK